MIGEMSAKMLMVVDRIWNKENFRQLLTAGRHSGCQKHLKCSLGYEDIVIFPRNKQIITIVKWGRRRLTPPSLASSEQVPTPEFLESHKISKEKLMRQKEKDARRVQLT